MKHIRLHIISVSKQLYCNILMPGYINTGISSFYSKYQSGKKNHVLYPRLEMLNFPLSFICILVIKRPREIQSSVKHLTSSTYEILGLKKSLNENISITKDWYVKRVNAPGLSVQESLLCDELQS